MVAGICISRDVGGVKSWVGACEPRGIDGTCRPKPLAAEGILALSATSGLGWSGVPANNDAGPAGCWLVEPAWQCISAVFVCFACEILHILHLHHNPTNGSKLSLRLASPMFLCIPSVCPITDAQSRCDQT